MKIGDKITDGSANFIVRKFGGGGQLIKGVIVTFSGTFSNNGYPINPETDTADEGWHICDGTHGTPDLRGRFILGASDGHTVGSTGGEENHTLNVNEMPSHNHTGTTSWNGDHNHSYRAPSSIEGNFMGFDRATKSAVNRTADWDTSTNGGHNHTFTTSNTGGSQPHNNMPPYYTLSYIMKL